MKEAPLSLSYFPNKETEAQNLTNMPVSYIQWVVNTGFELSYSSCHSLKRPLYRPLIMDELAGLGLMMIEMTRF